jgi:hypothetical protein
MADIAKHDSEEEGEYLNCKDSGVDFLVTGYSVGIDDLLEGGCELVDFEVGGGFGVGVGGPEGHKRGQQLVEQSYFFGWYPNGTNHDAVGFLHGVEGLENHGLPFKDNLVGIKEGDLKICGFDDTFEVLQIVFLGHHIELFGIGNAVLYFLDFGEDFVLIGGQLVPRHPKVIAYLSHLREQHVTAIDDADEGSSEPVLMGLLCFPGDAEGIEDTVPFGDSKDDFGELNDILGLKNPGHVNEFKLL